MPRSLGSRHSVSEANTFCVHSLLWGIIPFMTIVRRLFDRLIPLGVIVGIGVGAYVLDPFKIESFGDMFAKLLGGALYFLILVLVSVWTLGRICVDLVRGKSDENVLSHPAVIVAVGFVTAAILGVNVYIIWFA